jgi:hypothetical protein
VYSTEIASKLQKAGVELLAQFGHTIGISNEKLK